MILPVEAAVVAFPDVVVDQFRRRTCRFELTPGQRGKILAPGLRFVDIQTRVNIFRCRLGIRGFDQHQFVDVDAPCSEVFGKRERPRALAPAL